MYYYSIVYNYYNNISNIDNRILLSITTHDIPNNYKKETLIYIFSLSYTCSCVSSGLGASSFIKFSGSTADTVTLVCCGI